MNTRTPRGSRIPFILAIGIVCILANRSRLIAQTAPASTVPTPQELRPVLESNIRFVLKKKASERTSQELNAAAEAAYLIYSFKPTNEALKSLTADLSELWQEKNDNRRKAVRLSVLACEFNIGNMDEIADLSRAHAATNSVFSFFYSRRLLFSGQVTEAARIVADVQPAVTFSMEESVGFRDLLKSMQSQSGMTGDACAAVIWNAYSISDPVDFVDVVNIIGGNQYKHVGMSDERKDKLTLARIRAAISLTASDELIRSRHWGAQCLTDLRSELEARKRNYDISDDEYNRYIAEIKKGSSEIDKLQILTQKWVAFPFSSITGALAREMIEEGQSRVITRRLVEK